jgi:hypothetical protein
VPVHCYYGVIRLGCAYEYLPVQIYIVLEANRYNEEYCGNSVISE